jgi:hypothetical protein
MISTIFDKTYRIDHYEDPFECYDLLKSCSERYWADISRPSKTNYDFSSDGKNTIKFLIENNRFNLGYSIVYDDDIPMAFGGIRVIDDNTTIVAARAFCFYTPKLLINKILIPYQLSYSKSCGFSRSIISFNEYNHKIYKVWRRLTQSPDLVDAKFSVDYKKFNMLGKQIVNKMEQYTIEWIL